MISIASNVHISISEYCLHLLLTLPKNLDPIRQVISNNIIFFFLQYINILRNFLIFGASLPLCKCRLNQSGMLIIKITTISCHSSSTECSCLYMPRSISTAIQSFVMIFSKLFWFYLVIFVIFFLFLGKWFVWTCARPHSGTYTQVLVRMKRVFQNDTMRRENGSLKWVLLL